MGGKASSQAFEAMYGPASAVPNPIYQERLLAYIDIMGWTDLVERSVRNPKIVEPILRGAIALRSDGESYVSDIFPGYEVTHFSDLIVFSVPVSTPKCERIIWLKAYSLSRTLLFCGLLSRGAVVRGLLHHSKHYLFGPALIEAHKIERELARYPRIVVLPNAVPLLRDSALAIRTDQDGCSFIDLFHQMTNVERHKTRHKLQKHICHHVGDPKRLSNYAWLLNQLTKAERA